MLTLKPATGKSASVFNYEFKGFAPSKSNKVISKPFFCSLHVMIGKLCMCAYVQWLSQEVCFQNLWCLHVEGNSGYFTKKE